MTWYNIFLHYNEDRTCFHKLLSPFVLLFYPIWIVPVTLGLCLYGGVRCISWYWDSWIAEVCNPDSGFCAWICEQFNLPDCSPYQVVLLSAELENSKAPSPQNVWRIQKIKKQLLILLLLFLFSPILLSTHGSSQTTTKKKTVTNTQL